MDDTPLNYSCIGQGSTVEETIKDFRACYDEMRAHFQESGESFEEVNLVFCYDIPSFLQEFAFAFSLAGLERCPFLLIKVTPSGRLNRCICQSLAYVRKFIHPYK